LVQTLPGADPSAVTAAYQDSNVQIVNQLTDLNLTTVRVPDRDLEEAARSLANAGVFEAIHKNYIYQLQRTPNDPSFVQQDHLQQIGLPDAWESTTGSDEIIIGIVDSGVDRDHPDLREKILEGYNIVDENDDFDDELGHGTQTAGVAAAAGDNGLGVAGVAWDSPIVVARVTDSSGSATSRNIAGGILWAASRNARVINVSFAPLWSNSIVEVASQKAFGYGSMVVISSGNGGLERDAEGYEEAIFVTATNSDDEVTSFSDHGEFVDVAAPGEALLTTAMQGQYEVVSGTSFAAPMVSGVLALCWSTNPSLRPQSIRNSLLASSLDAGETGKDILYGNGLLAADMAISAIAKLESIPDDEGPSLTIRSYQDGDRVNGQITIGIEAEDDWGIADVVMYVDGTVQATDTTQPYRFLLDPGGFASGLHDVSFIASDFSGNRSEETGVQLNFASSASGVSLPVVEFESHASGEVVSGDVLLQAQIESTLELLSIEWMIDEEPVFSSSASGTNTQVSYLWRTEEFSESSHVITLVTTDIGGRQVTKSLTLSIE
ncbi:MAG: S8 family serine peptidase, partial [Phycisphaerae bacterium]